MERYELPAHLRRGRRILLLAGVVCLALSSDALAWGPASHVAQAETILDHLHLLPAGLALLLSRYRRTYLYGSIVADVVFGKRFSRIKHFCHHWSTAFHLLDQAEDDRSRALAYGYLTHLAADTVAHGKYVPRQFVTHNSSRNLGHLFWELQADTLITPDSWTSLEELLEEDHTTHHAQLARHLSLAWLPYSLNRKLFERINALAVRQEIHWTVDRWGKAARRQVDPKLIAAYQAESMDRIVSVLRYGEYSPVMRDDPNGATVLAQVAELQRELRSRRLRGLPIQRRIREIEIALNPTPIHRLEYRVDITPRLRRVASRPVAASAAMAEAS
jgi:hypothetical protein